jgi:hypothetical protein
MRGTSMMTIIRFADQYKCPTIDVGRANHKHAFLAVLMLLGTLAGCQDEISPLLSNCTAPTVSSGISLGTGKDEFEPTNSIEQALIVGGYQGGYHLWGAIKVPDRVAIDSISRLHIQLCADDVLIAEALYGSVDSIHRSDSALYGIPVVFATGVDVQSLAGSTVTMVAGIETEGTPSFATTDVELECCGHVADGD